MAANSAGCFDHMWFKSAEVKYCFAGGAPCDVVILLILHATLQFIHFEVEG